MSETKKPKKIAYVRQGRSILTKLGCAQAGATVTPDMISAGTPESQLTIWYRQIRDENGTLELPKKLKTVLSESADGQLRLEELFGDDPPDDDPPDDDPPDDDPPENEKPRPRSAKRKPPGDKPPGDKPPGDKPSGDKPPVDKPPGAKPPEAKPPGGEPPAGKPPGDKPPGGKPPGDKLPAGKSPADKPSKDKLTDSKTSLPPAEDEESRPRGAKRKEK